MELRTPRLLLREFEVGDCEAVLRYQSDARYLEFSHWTGRTSEEVRDFVQMFIEQQFEEPRWRWQLAIVPDEVGRVVGNCGLRLERPRARVGDVGYELGPEYWGRGYATEAAQEMLRFGFGVLGLHRIGAWCIGDNVGSQRVLERLGMRFEGQQREFEWFKGRWWDHRLYGLLAREWREAAR